MPDIQLRFQKDMLVLSAPIDVTLARQGVNAALDREYLNLMEPDSIEDALKLEVAAGAQCVVTTTEDITRARLAHVRMDSDASKLASAALRIANNARPQHVLAEIGPCGLPLDAASKASLNESRAQYADAARAFGDGRFDAFFLNGFAKVADLKCALMGVAQVSDKPIFASVTIGALPCVEPAGGAAAEAAEAVLPALPFDGYALLDNPASPPAPVRAGLDPVAWPEALDAMIDLGAAVVGFETAEPIGSALAFVETATARTDLPVLAQLHVAPGSDKNAVKNLTPLDDIDDYTPDTMATAAVKLYGAGVQFLRATGSATPAYTGALAATVAGLDVHSNASEGTVPFNAVPGGRGAMSVEPSPSFGALQSIVDDLFEGKPRGFTVRRLDVVIASESSDLPADLAEIVNLLPPGDFTRQKLCDQLNSAIGGHAWGQVYGTVE